jgi:hypothetical protein
MGPLAAHYLGINVLNNISGLGTTFMKEGWLNQLVQDIVPNFIKK